MKVGYGITGLSMAGGRIKIKFQQGLDFFILIDGMQDNSIIDNGMCNEKRKITVMKMQCPWPGHEQGPLDPETSTIWSPQKVKVNIYCTGPIRTEQFV